MIHRQQQQHQQEKCCSIRNKSNKNCHRWLVLLSSSWKQQHSRTSCVQRIERSTVATARYYYYYVSIILLLALLSIVQFPSMYNYIRTTTSTMMGLLHDDSNNYYVYYYDTNEDDMYRINMTSHRNSYNYSIINDPNRLRLRLDYTNLERLSHVAKLIETTQNDCSINKTTQLLFKHRPYAGLGSALHVYSTAICNTLEYPDHAARLRTMASWAFYDEELCNQHFLEERAILLEEERAIRMSSYNTNNSNNSASASSTTKKTTTTTLGTINITNRTMRTSYTDSPMACYFPSIEPICDGDFIRGRQPQLIPIADYEGEVDVDVLSCPKTTELYTTPVIRASTTEYLFTRVSTLVIMEAERQLNQLFYHNTTTTDQQPPKVPPNLITVHIRWGDKHTEMKLLSIERYIKAVHKIIDTRKRKYRASTKYDNNRDATTITTINDVNILLCTEDPEAVTKFMDKKPDHWNVYLDQYYIEMLPSRQVIGNIVNGNVGHTINFRGHNGLIALGSLLVAMESNDYVLTTGSNWSRLINEIRKNIIDPRCNNCTTMIDLLYGEY